MLTAVLRRARAARASGERGITLAELLVAMVIMSIFGLLTARLFLQVDNSSSSATDRSIASASAGSVMHAWTEYLRVADGTTAGSASNRFEWITPKDMLFYADLYNRPYTTGVGTTGAATMVWLRLDSKRVLVEEQFPATATAGASPTRCRRLLSNVDAGNGSGSNLLFQPSTLAGSDMTALLNAGKLGTAPTASAGCQKLPVTPPSQLKKQDPTAAANLPNVGRIAIDFVVSDTKNKHTIEFLSVVTLPVLGGSL